MPPQDQPTPDNITRPGWSHVWKEFWNELVTAPLEGKMAAIAKDFTAHLTAIVVGVFIELQGAIARQVGQGIKRVEDEAGPRLLEAAAFGIEDLFGIKVSPSELGFRGKTSGRLSIEQRIGRAIFDGLFQVLGGGQPVTPARGRQNAENAIGWITGTALEGWLMGILDRAAFGKYFPNYGQLDDVMIQALGLGRLARRLLQPLLTISTIEPLTWDLNLRYRPNEWNESQAVRALNRGAISEADYFDRMGRLGWSRDRAAQLRVITSPLPSKADVEAGLELGLLTEQEADRAFRDAGYPPEWAQRFVAFARDNRLRAANSALAGVARDMFRDRALTEAEYRQLLELARMSPAEVSAWTAIGLIERSRPAELQAGAVQDMYERDIVDVAFVREYYVAQGYAARDVGLLERLAEERKKSATVPKEAERVPRSVQEEAFMRGLISEGQLAAFYKEAGFTPADAAVLLELARARKAEAAAKRKPRAAAG